MNEGAEIVAETRPGAAATELRTLGLISAAHWVSHYHLLVVPMLFPFLRTELGIDFVDLGIALTVLAVVSALTQAPTGYLVDRFGARKILMGGLCLGSVGLMLLGWRTSYPALIAGAVMLGLANSVYHPANYAILSAHTDSGRIGRAFSIHTFAGYLGGAVAPAIVAALVTVSGGTGALIVSGATGLVVALALVLFRVPEAGGGARKSPSSGEAPKRALVTRPLVLLTVFFMLLGLSNAGIANFGVVALMDGYSASFASANLVLTAYLTASALGVLAGGVLADRTRRHGQFAAACFAVNAAIVLSIALFAVPAGLLTVAMTAAGFLSGVIAPSRDMLVRSAAPIGAAGAAFGLVSTGFNVSGILAPILFGYVMDQHMPAWVFGISAAFMALTVVLAMSTERR